MCSSHLLLSTDIDYKHNFKSWITHRRPYFISIKGTQRGSLMMALQVQLCKKNLAPQRYNHRVSTLRLRCFLVAKAIICKRSYISIAIVPGVELCVRGSHASGVWRLEGVAVPVARVLNLFLLGCTHRTFPPRVQMSCLMYRCALQSLTFSSKNIVDIEISNLPRCTSPRIPEGWMAARTL